MSSVIVRLHPPRLMGSLVFTIYYEPFPNIDVIYLRQSSSQFHIAPLSEKKEKETSYLNVFLYHTGILTPGELLQYR